MAFIKLHTKTNVILQYLIYHLLRGETHTLLHLDAKRSKKVLGQQNVRSDLRLIHSYVGIVNRHPSELVDEAEKIQIEGQDDDPGVDAGDDVEKLFRIGNFACHAPRHACN